MHSVFKWALINIYGPMTFKFHKFRGKIDTQGKVTHFCQLLLRLKFNSHFFSFFVENEKTGFFQLSGSITFDSSQNWKHLSLRNTLSYNYTNYTKNLLTFDILIAWVKQPCFSEIQYGERAKTFPACVWVCWSIRNRWSSTLLNHWLDIHNWFDNMRKMLYT